MNPFHNLIALQGLTCLPRLLQAGADRGQTIIKLAKGFGVKVGVFFGETEGEPFTIVREDERKTVSRFAYIDGVKYAYSYESLGFDKKDRHMEPFIIALEPATIKTSKTSVHEGEEFTFVLKGEMEVILGSHTDVLYPGDSIYYNSNIPHRVQCHEDRITKILVVRYTLNN